MLINKDLLKLGTISQKMNNKRFTFPCLAFDNEKHICYSTDGKGLILNQYPETKIENDHAFYGQTKINFPDNTLYPETLNENISIDSETWKTISNLVKPKTRLSKNRLRPDWTNYIQFFNRETLYFCRIFKDEYFIDINIKTPFKEIPYKTVFPDNLSIKNDNVIEISFDPFLLAEISKALKFETIKLRIEKKDNGIMLINNSKDYTQNNGIAILMQAPTDNKNDTEYNKYCSIVKDIINDI